jgi:uncharacterized protein YyaL (SSP411 family)
MLYDNAQLLGVYARWWRRTSNPLGARIAIETADFLVRELGTVEGGFASALDADSEGVEGKYYVWTPAELVETLGQQDGAWAAGLLEVTVDGTFEEGASTLQLRRDPDEPDRWEHAREVLLAARAHRVRPARDDKVVAAWNGLAVGALAQAGVLLDHPEHVEAARRAAALLLRVHVRDGHLARVSRDGVAGPHAGVLEDYGCVASGLLSLFQATGDAGWLEPAGRLLDVALEEFAADDGGFHDTSATAEPLVARPRDPTDNASPSGLSAVVEALLTYSALTGSGRHRDVAEAALRTVRPIAEQAPRFAGWSLAAAEAALAGPLEIAVVGEPGDPATADLLRVARRSSSPGAVVLPGRPAGEGMAAAPLLEGRGLVAGKAAAYVCRGLVCERPVTSADDLRTALGA